MKKTKAFYLIVVLAVSGLLLSAVNAQTIPEEARRHMARGEMAVEMAKSPEDYESAIREFQEATRLAPDWSDLYYKLGLVQEKAGKLREAITSLNEYLRLAPNAPDAANVKELIYKLEYKAEQVLIIADIIDVLVSFHSQFEKKGKCMSNSWGELVLVREGDTAVKALRTCLYYPYRESYQTLKIAGPVLRYITTVNVCHPSADRELGGCDAVVEHGVEVVSKTLVKTNHKVLRGGSGAGIATGDKFSCEYRKR